MDDRYVEKVKDTYTVSDLSTNQCPMKRFVLQVFVILHEEKIFDLKANKKNY